MINTLYGKKESMRNKISFDLFNKDFRNQRVEIFLCGPGFLHGEFDWRTKIRAMLDRYSGVNVIFGEDIISKKIPARIRLQIRQEKINKDLLTAEIKLALGTDATLLLANSPGALAELGTFCAIENISKKLFVMVNETHHGGESYISRGPLSYLNKINSMSVIYYNEEDLANLEKRIFHLVGLAKFRRYSSVTMSSIAKNSFEKMLVGIAIQILQPVDMPNIQSFTRIDVKFIKATLGEFVKAGHIKRIGKFQYVMDRNFKQNFDQFGIINMDQISRLRALVALNESNPR